MTDSKAPRNVVMSDFLAVKSTFASETRNSIMNSLILLSRYYDSTLIRLIKSKNNSNEISGNYMIHILIFNTLSYLPKTLPACTTIINTVILHGWCVGECWGDAGHDTSILADVQICSLLLFRSLATRCRYEGENIVSSKNIKRDIILTVPYRKNKEERSKYYYSIS